MTTLKTLLLALTAFVFLAAGSPTVSFAEQHKAQRSKTSAKRGKKAKKAKKGKSRKKKKKKRKKRRRKDGRLNYTVIPGDTLGAIAKRHGVKSKDIKRWNKLKGTRISKGQKLVIFAKKAPRQRRKSTHVIKRGETLKGIAKKHKVKVGDILGWNPRVHPRRLKVGKKLTVYKRGPAVPSGSSGSANAGRLLAGELLPKGVGYYVRSPGRAYGTNETISLLQTVIGANKRKFKKAHDLVIGDVSRKKGGYLRPHKSHQSGRDADIGYYIKGLKNPKRFHVATPKTIDAKRTWTLFKSFIGTGRVQYIFVNYNLQKVLYEYALKHGSTKKSLAKVFQYPRGKGATVGTIRNSRGHDDHFHIRFKCPRGDRTCR